MDFNKVSEHSILLIVTAIAAFVIAVVMRYLCIQSGYDTGTANLVFVIALGILVVLYLLLIKVIINQTERFIARRRKKTIGGVAENTPIIETVHDRIVREKFEQSVTDYCVYTEKMLGKHIPVEELKRLNEYIDLFAREKKIDKPLAIKIPSSKVSNNDLYHYGWKGGFREPRRDRAKNH